MDDRLLGIYLNDHLAGATAGLELARRSAGRNKGTEVGRVLDQITDQIEEERGALRGVMERLGVVANPVKTGAAWMAERIGRAKLNGHLLSYSPLSRVEELEALVLGVSGKACLWRALSQARGSDPRLEGVDLEELARRADAQRDRLEELRIRSAVTAFGTAAARS